MSKKFIQIEQLTKRYGNKPGDKVALKGVSLDIYRGEILALLGVNGAGKTTLSSIVAGIHPLTSGTILCDGKSIYDDITTYRKKIGFCPQKPTFFMQAATMVRVGMNVTVVSKHLLNDFLLAATSKSEQGFCQGDTNSAF
jgi:ABC-type multidrug transport system ATPase subunit